MNIKSFVVNSTDKKETLTLEEIKNKAGLYITRESPYWILIVPNCYENNKPILCVTENTIVVINETSWKYLTFNKFDGEISLTISS